MQWYGNEPNVCNSFREIVLCGTTDEIKLVLLLIGSAGSFSFLPCEMSAGVVASDRQGRNRTLLQLRLLAFELELQQFEVDDLLD